jgi:uncharacterized protein (DUF779 family)
MIMMNTPQLELGQQVEATSSNSMKIEIPKKTDVLCGRGKMRFHHEGNDSFRMLIAEHSETYKMAPTKKLKMQVVELVVDVVFSRGGRFLIQVADGSWVDGGKKQGKVKTGHAMRDALRGKVKRITKMRESHAQELRDTSDDPSYSSSSLSSSIDEFDIDNNIDSWLDEMKKTNPSSLEPFKNWKHTKVDKETAQDLFNFFIAQELRTPDNCQS